MKRGIAFAAAAVGTICGLALAGCSTGAGGGQATPGTSTDATSAGQARTQPVALTFWGTYGNGGNTAQTDVLDKQLIPAFEAAHPGITVNYVDIPYDSLKQKLTTGAAGDQLPDVLRSDIGWIAQFADLGVFAPLDTAMPDFDTLAATTYPGTLAANKWGDHYYGLPLDTNTRVLVTSQAALDKAGMSAPPATFAEFKQMAAALQGSGMYAFADSGLSGWNILPWIWSGGGDITDPDVTKATGFLDSPTSVAAVQMLVDMYSAGQIPNLITGNQGATSTSDGVPGGQYATILDGPWMNDIWAGQYPDFKPIYAPMPAGDGGSISVVGGESMVMIASTTHAEAAQQFIAYTLSDEFQLAMAGAGQMSVVAALGPKEVEANPLYQVFSTQLETAKARLNIPQASDVDSILSEELTPAFEGSVSVQDALTKAAGRIDPLLSAQ